MQYNPSTIEHGERLNCNNNNKFNTHLGIRYLKYPYRMCRCLKCALPNRLHTALDHTTQNQAQSHSLCA